MRSGGGVGGGLGRRAAVLAVATGLLATVLAGAPTAVAEDTPVIETSYEVAATPEPDGRAVNLDVSLFTTDPGLAQPAIVLAHGFGGSKADGAEIGRTLARDGYTVLTYTARGFGRSGGLIHLDDPRFEGADTQRLIDFAADRSEVAREMGGNGSDPVIGFAGASYGGAASLLAAGLDRRVDAIVPAYTWHSLRQALVPQHVVSGTQSSAAAISPAATAGTFKERWAALFFGAGRSGDNGGDLCGRFSPEICRAYVSTAQSGRPAPELSTLLGRSEMAQVLSRITAPTLIVHGEDDTLFGLDQADANFSGLPASTTKAMAWVVGGHDVGIDLDAQLPRLRGWFDRHLKSEAVPGPPEFSVDVPQTRLVGQNAGVRPPQVLTAADYPVGDQVVPTALPLLGEQQSLVNPPGAVPTALTSLPGTGEALAAVTRVGGYRLAALPGQTATFTTAPLTEPLTLVGSGRIALSVTSSTREATLFASIWDLGPDGTGAQEGEPQTAILPQRAVAPVHVTDLTPGRSSTVQVALPAVVHQVPVGHRVQVMLATTDQAYAGPAVATAYTVALADAPELRLLPLPLTAQTAALQVPWWLVVAVGALVLVAVAAIIALGVRRRRAERSASSRPELAHLPLAVEGLVKTYGDGVRAVDGVSFRAGVGQVVGLLGPNGAGKTTTMRMLVGLIRPDAGEVYVGGRPVHAGADVLSSVGAFIEGPGFLPHLTGLQNLTSYWSATGRPLSEARLEEALEIAALGPAVNRKVRGYSQGMRQRLGIAQAMLGLPPLLLLDEPTNGLDPPQIRAMRQVFADYAASGRTVVISSHLLAEVERTCTHVVVMHRGTVVLAGDIAEVTGGDPDHRRRLEDVFMGLVGAAGHEVVESRG